MYYVGLFILLGCLAGFFSGLLVIQCEGKIARSVSTGLVGTGIFVGNNGIFSFFDIIDRKEKIISYTFFLLFYVVGLICIFFVVKRGLEKKDVKYKISLVDIFVGQKKVVEDHFNLAKKEIEQNLENERIDLEKLKKEKDIIILEKEKYESIKKTVEKKIRELNGLTMNNCNLPIPGDIKHIVKEDFLDNCVYIVKDLLEFSSKIREITKSYVESINATKCEERKNAIFEAFTYDLCLITGEKFFTSRDVRVHFRYLKENKYVKFSCIGGGKIYKRNISDIPFGEGMIKTASVEKRSLIKSLNPLSHYKGENDAIWIDYLTMIFPEFLDEGKSFLTMGISIKNRSHTNTLLFLNYIKFEDIIQNELVYLNDETQTIDKFIERLKEEHEEVA